MQNIVNREAREHELPLEIINALISVESDWNPDALSPAGASGLMQLMPETAAQYGVPEADLMDPEKNIRAGIQHLSYLYSLYDGDWQKVWAAYNAGEGRVNDWVNKGRALPKETQDYIKKIEAKLSLGDKERAVAELGAESATPQELASQMGIPVHKFLEWAMPSGHLFS